MAVIYCQNVYDPVFERVAHYVRKRAYERLADIAIRYRVNLRTLRDTIKNFIQTNNKPSSQTPSRIFV